MYHALKQGIMQPRTNSQSMKLKNNIHNLANKSMDS